MSFYVTFKNSTQRSPSEADSRSDGQKTPRYVRKTKNHHNVHSPPFSLLDGTYISRIQIQFTSLHVPFDTLCPHLGLESWFSSYKINILYSFLSPRVLRHSTHLISLNFVVIVIHGEEYILRSSSLRTFRNPVASPSPISFNMFLCTLFSYTLTTSFRSCANNYSGLHTIRVSLEFFSDIILPAALGPWATLSL